MTAQPDTEWEYTFVGDLKVGDQVRLYGQVKKIQKGTLTNTIYFDTEGVTRVITWHEFHSVEVKKESE